MKDQAVRAMEAAAALVLLALIAAILTGTENVTYGQGLGVSGWVIDNNRCANSIILVTLSCFAVYYAAKSGRKSAYILVPAAVCAVFISNGTKACYFGIFAVFLGFAAFLVLDRAVNKTRLNSLLLAVLIALSAVSAAVYPYTPRAKVEALQASAVALKDQDELVRLLKEKGYDPQSMTTEEKLADPVVREIFETYYTKLMWHVIPEMFDRFGIERIMREYDMTTSAATLIDVRLMKRTYAKMIWQEQDALTKLTGFEVSEIKDPAYDPEKRLACPVLLLRLSRLRPLHRIHPPFHLEAYKMRDKGLPRQSEPFEFHAAAVPRAATESCRVLRRAAAPAECVRVSLRAARAHILPHGARTGGQEGGR